MNFNRIGFIGCGNMGSALARCAALAVARNGSGELLLSNRSTEKAEKLAAELGARAVSNESVAEQAELIFLGVKPQFIEDVLSGISTILAARKDRFILVSMIAGLTMQRVRELAGGAYPVIRIMPNTACAVGAGMMQYSGDGVSDAELDAFCELMAPSGTLDALDERLLDAAASVSGCGPAFLCLALEGMADGGVSLGLPRCKAVKYAAATLEGLGKLALESGLHTGDLKDQVTSPGGTTIQGVRALENFAVRAAFIEAVTAAYERTQELKKSG